jgi:uncharacterized membrane protein YfcA
MTDPLRALVWLCLSALGAGAVNAVAGGGTLLTFPALLAVLSPYGAAEAAVIANATSTVALVPGSLAGAWGYRSELQHVRRWAMLLLVPSLLGGAVGSLLVTRLDPHIFAALVPWLILAAAVLFLIQPLAARLRGPRKATPSWATLGILMVFQFLVAVYGGYFGAGIGILMLASLGLMGLADVHQMNSVKTLLNVAINGVSVVVFVAENKVRWDYALAMAAAAILGGYLGARAARRVPQPLVRWFIIAIGFGLAAYFFYQQWAGKPADPAPQSALSARTYREYHPVRNDRRHPEGPPSAVQGIAWPPTRCAARATRTGSSWPRRRTTTPAADSLPLTANPSSRLTACPPAGCVWRRVG